MGGRQVDFVTALNVLTLVLLGGNALTTVLTSLYLVTSAKVMTDVSLS